MKHLTELASRALLLVALTSPLALTACGSSDIGSSQKNTTDLTVGALPVADYAPLFYAAEKGLFKKQGLNVKVEPIQGGANAVPALLNGDFSLAVTNWTSYVQALSEDIPVRAVLPAAEGAPGYSAVVAAPRSGIKSADDLVGHTIAVNNLKSIAELATRVGLEESGVNPDDVKYTELPLPDTAAALANGTVDAAFVVEPFLSAALAQGAVVIFDPFAGKLDGMPLGGLSTSEDFAAANPQTLDKFATAMAEATDALSNEATFRDFLPSYTGLPPEVAQRLTLPTTQTDFAANSLDDLVARMQDFGWIDKDPGVAGSLAYLHSEG